MYKGVYIGKNINDQSKKILVLGNLTIQVMAMAVLQQSKPCTKNVQNLLKSIEHLLKRCV